MKKTGIYIMLLFLLSWQWVMAGEDVRLTAQGPAEVNVGQQFQIVYGVNANARNFTPPDFKGLIVLSGPNTSSSSSIQYINGQMSQSYNLSYSYVVMATHPGNVNVGSATVTYKGKKYTSNGLRINILKSNAKPYAGNPSQGVQRNPQANNGTRETPEETGHISNKDVFIRATNNNSHPYLGQQIVVTYRIYTRVPVSNLAINKVASFKGLWSQDLLSNNITLKQRNEIINGHQYVVAVIRKLALIPQRTGKLTIDPMHLQCSVQIRIQKKQSNNYNPFADFFNNPFFNQNVRNISKTLVSNPIIIHVKPLPEKGKPASFAGAVGDFRLKTGVNRTNVSTNGALTLTASITGKGNIELIGAPKVKFPGDFETYTPKVVLNIIKTGEGISGSKKFEFLAIPRNPGDVVIKPVKFSYFNPQDKKYHTQISDAIHIHVAKGKGNGGVMFSGNTQENIRFLGKDIRNIESGPYYLMKVNDYLFGSVLFYLLLLIPIILLLVVIVLWKTARKRKSNISLLKNRKANKLARNRLLKAQKIKKQGDDNAFYDEIALALWGYIADKFNLKQTDLSMDTVKEKLEQQKVSEETITGFIYTLNNIEFARFAPGNIKDKMENIYSEAMNAILQAEKSLK